MNNQGIPPPGFQPPPPGFSNQPIYPYMQPQPGVYPQYPVHHQEPEFSPPPYPVQSPSAPEFSAPPPYNPGYPPPTPPPPTQAPTVTEIRPVNFGSETARLICPHCQADISTRVETEASTKAHLTAMILCILGCWLCVPCPYCADSCMTAKHYCPSCNAYLGSCEP